MKYVRVVETLSDGLMDELKEEDLKKAKKQEEELEQVTEPNQEEVELLEEL